MTKVLLIPLLLLGCSSGAPQVTPTVTSTLVPHQTATPTRTATPPRLAETTQESLRPTPTPFVHEVVEGETLLDIALQYGVALDEMLAANPGIDPHFLSIGQTLRIPGPEGEPVDTLLPTATPLPIEVSQGACHPSAGGALICLAAVTNQTDEPVEGITARVQLLDEAGEVFASDLAFTPINRLPPAARLPLAAYFPVGTASPANARFSLLSAVGSVAEEERYAELELSDVETIAGSEGRTWQVKAELDLPDASAGVHLSLVALGTTSEGQLAGYAKWEPEMDAEAPYQVDLLVFSLGPPIDSIEILAEAVIAPAE